MRDTDDLYDDEEDDSGDLVDDFDDDDDEPTIDCPYCGKEMLEDSPRCPHCERYISEEDSPPRKKSWLVIVGACLCLYIVYRWIVG